MEPTPKPDSSPARPADNARTQNAYDDPHDEIEAVWRIPGALAARRLSRVNRSDVSRLMALMRLSGTLR